MGKSKNSKAPVPFSGCLFLCNVIDRQRPQNMGNVKFNEPPVPECRFIAQGNPTFTPKVSLKHKTAYLQQIVRKSHIKLLIQQMNGPDAGICMDWSSSKAPMDIICYCGRKRKINIGSVLQIRVPLLTRIRTTRRPHPGNPSIGKI